MIFSKHDLKTKSSIFIIDEWFFYIHTSNTLPRKFTESRSSIRIKKQFLCRFNIQMYVWYFAFVCFTQIKNDVIKLNMFLWNALIHCQNVFHILMKKIIKIWNFQLNSHLKIFYVISTFRIQFSSNISQYERSVWQSIKHLNTSLFRTESYIFIYWCDWWEWVSKSC